MIVCCFVTLFDSSMYFRVSDVKRKRRQSKVASIEENLITLYLLKIHLVLQNQPATLFIIPNSVRLQFGIQLLSFRRSFSLYACWLVRLAMQGGFQLQEMVQKYSSVWHVGSQ